MFKNLRPTPTAFGGIQEDDNTETTKGKPADVKVKCRYCGFYADKDRDARCPFCNSDNYI